MLSGAKRSRFVFVAAVTLLLLETSCFFFTVRGEQCILGKSPPRGYYADSSPHHWAITPDSDISPGTKAFIICRTGYSLFDGPDSTTCQLDGTWRPDLSRLGKCRRPTSSTAAPEDQTTPTETPKPQPLRPKTTPSTTTSTTQSPETAPSQTCELPRVPNGNFATATSRNVIIAGRWVKPGTRVILTCLDGSSVVGGASRAICRINFEWSEKLGNCGETNVPGSDTICGEEIQTENGILIGSGNRINNKRRIQCYPGYQQKGTGEVTCSRNGQWLPDIGQCIREDLLGNVCDQFPTLQDAFVLGDSQVAYVGETRQVKCTENHILEPGVNSTGGTLRSADRAIRCNGEGKWSQWLGKCATVCGAVPSIKDGFITSGTNEIGVLRNIKCTDPSLSVLGATFITCCWNGQWTAPGGCYDKKSVPGATQLYLQQQASAQCPPSPQEMTYCPGWSMLLSADCASRRQKEPQSIIAPSPTKSYAAMTVRYSLATLVLSTLLHICG